MKALLVVLLGLFLPLCSHAQHIGAALTGDADTWWVHENDEEVSTGSIKFVGMEFVWTQRMPSIHVGGQELETHLTMFGNWVSTGSIRSTNRVVLTPTNCIIQIGDRGTTFTQDDTSVISFLSVLLNIPSDSISKGFTFLFDPFLWRLTLEDESLLYGDDERVFQNRYSYHPAGKAATNETSWGQIKESFQ